MSSLGFGVLQQVADRARVERADDPVSVREGRERDHVRVRRRRADPAGRLDPVHVGHLEVEERDIGSLGRAALHRLVAVRGDAHELDVVERAEQLLQPGAHHAVVVGDHDPDHGSGTSNRTTVPRPGCESTWSPPPTSRARSSSSVRPRWPFRARRRLVDRRESHAVVARSRASHLDRSLADVRATWLRVRVRRRRCGSLREMRGTAATRPRAAGSGPREPGHPSVSTSSASGAVRSANAARSPARCRSGG